MPGAAVHTARPAIAVRASAHGMGAAAADDGTAGLCRPCHVVAQQWRQTTAAADTRMFAHPARGPTLSASGHHLHWYGLEGLGWISMNRYYETGWVPVARRRGTNTRPISSRQCLVAGGSCVAGRLDSGIPAHPMPPARSSAVSSWPRIGSRCRIRIPAEPRQINHRRPHQQVLNRLG